MEFPKRLVVIMAENGYIVTDSPGDHYATSREWVFTTSSQLGAWIRDNAPSYGLGGNAPPYLPEVK